MKKLILFILAALLCSAVEAQENNVLIPADSEVYSDYDSPPMNIIKTNISSIVLNNYSIQYERVLSRKISLSLSYRFMPNGSVPLKSTVLSYIESDDAEDSDIEDVLNNMKMSNSAVTLEMRLYLSKKGYGRGFYIAPYYRYSNFKFSDINIDYENEASVESTVHIGGKVSAHSGGLMLGAQWAIGKSFVIDWWIIGGHLGSSSGNIGGTPNNPLTPYEQQEIRSTIEDFEFSDMIKEINISANGVDVKIDGPWAGIRAGVSLGYRF